MILRMLSASPVRNRQASGGTCLFFTSAIMLAFLFLARSEVSLGSKLMVTRR